MLGQIRNITRKHKTRGTNQWWWCGYLILIISISPLVTLRTQLGAQSLLNMAAVKNKLRPNWARRHLEMLLTNHWEDICATFSHNNSFILTFSLVLISKQFVSSTPAAWWIFSCKQPVIKSVFIIRINLRKNMVSICVFERCQDRYDVFLYVVPGFGSFPLLYVGFQMFPIILW